MSLTEKNEAEHKTYYLKGGDKKPTIELICYNDDGSVHDLTSATNAKLVVAPVVGGRRVVDLGAMTFATDRTTGVVKYTWAGTETVPGEYLMEVIVDYGLSTQESFPRGSYYKLFIVEHL